MKKTLLLTFLGLGILFFSCTERPPPQIAEDFVARRPLSVAVLPAVYYPADQEEASKVDVKSGYYMSLVLKPPHLKNWVLQQMEAEVREKLSNRGLEIKNKEQVHWALGEFKFPETFDWKNFAQSLQVDSLAFVTLYEWDLKRYAKNKSARVLVEVAIYNAQNGDLLWSDRNFPITLRVGVTTDNKKLIELLSDRAVSSAFQSFPMKP